MSFWYLGFRCTPLNGTVGKFEINSAIYVVYDTLPKFILGSRVPKSMPNVMNIDVLAVEAEIFCFHLAKVKKVFVTS